MKEFFINVFDVCVRTLPRGWRITIAITLFCVALLSFRLSFRKKNDKHPLAVGWIVLCLLSLFVAIVYMAV